MFVIALVLSLFTTAFAGVFQDRYADCERRGDTEGMEQAHSDALAQGVSNQPERPSTREPRDPPPGYRPGNDNSNPNSDAPSGMRGNVNLNEDYKQKIDSTNNPVEKAYYEQQRNIKLIETGQADKITSEFKEFRTIGTTVDGKSPTISQDAIDKMKPYLIQKCLDQDPPVDPKNESNLQAALDEVLNNFSLDGAGYKTPNGDIRMTEGGITYTKSKNGGWEEVENSAISKNAVKLSPEQLNKILANKQKYEEANEQGNHELADKIHRETEEIRKGLGYTQGSTGGYFGTTVKGYTGGGGGGGGEAYPGEGSGKLTIYSITANSGSHGSVTPAGTTNLLKGATQSYTIVPDEGYVINTVTIDGANNGSISSFTFFRVLSDHTISATFKSKAEFKITGGSMTGVDKDGKTKSGYGIGAILNATATNVVVKDAYVTFSNGATYQMELVGSKLMFVVNPASKTGARAYYIPVATKDGPFVLKYTIIMANVDDPKDTIDASFTQTITIAGSMYEDDFTGDR